MRAGKGASRGRGQRDVMAEDIVVPDYEDSTQADDGALSMDDLEMMQAKPPSLTVCDKVPLSRTHALGL